MKKLKRKGSQSKDVDWAEFEALHSLEYGLGELLMACEGVAIGMNNKFEYEVWGKLRFAPGAEMVRLSVVSGDLREAVRQAHEAAHELQMPRLIQVRARE